MVHIYIGDGKGKTTLALGLALRAIGAYKKVYIGQFLKDSKFESSEIKAIRTFNLKIKIERFKDQTHPIFLKKNKKSVIKKTKKSVNDSFLKIKRYLETKKFDIVILDEILNLLPIKFLSLSKLIKIIDIANKKNIELVLTGRSSPFNLIKIADYVSFIKKIKHPFDKNIFSRYGIEY